MISVIDTHLSNAFRYPSEDACIELDMQSQLEGRFRQKYSYLKFVKYTLLKP